MEKKTAFYLGYEINEPLRSRIIETITRINAGGSTDKLNSYAADTLIDITNSGFLAYYDTPTSLVKLSSTTKLATDAGVHTVQKAIQMVIRKLIRKRSIDDLKNLAFNLSHLICLNNDNPSDTYACFRIPKSLYDKAQGVIVKVQNDPNPDLYRHEIIETIEDMIGVGIDMFYTRPVSQANIGKLTRKAADVSMGGVQKGINGVINRLFRNMDHEELTTLSHYLSSLLHSNVSTYYRVQQAASEQP